MSNDSQRVRNSLGLVEVMKLLLSQVHQNFTNMGRVGVVPGDAEEFLFHLKRLEDFLNDWTRDMEQALEAIQ